MTPLERALLKALREPAIFSEHILRRPLRYYQAAPIAAIYDSISRHSGHTFTLMFARQMGKNETSAHLEAFLMNRFQIKGGTIIKAAPTLHPQAINSKLRLCQMLSNGLNQSDWHTKDGYITLGAARALFMSGHPDASTVGLTANLLLEIDEAQDFDEQKYSKDFRPMAATTNATAVLYGTAWTGNTLLEHQIAINKDLQQRDGIQRHFQYDWQTLADLSPEYGAFVDAERNRLGEDHPIFRTQYKLQTIAGEARFLTEQHATHLRGTHARTSTPRAGAVYVAGIDLAGESEETADIALSAKEPKQDAVTVTIAEITPPDTLSPDRLPTAHVIEHYHWTGQKHAALYQTLIDILRNIWHCQHVTIDATGIGATVASFLEQALGPNIVEKFVFTSPSKSTLGYDLLAAINAGRLKMYTQNADQFIAPLFWRQIAASRYEMRASQTLNFYVPVSEGHDDLLMGLALCSHAAAQITQPAAGTHICQPKPYDDGRF